MVFTIDLTMVHSYAGLHEHLKKVFSLPSYYGRNMDALWDMLHCAFEEPTIIEVRGIDSIQNDCLKVFTDRLQLVLANLSKEDGVTIIYL